MLLVVCAVYDALLAGGRGAVCCVLYAVFLFFSAYPAGYLENPQFLGTRYQTGHAKIGLPAGRYGYISLEIIRAPRVYGQPAGPDPNILYLVHTSKKI